MNIFNKVIKILKMGAWYPFYNTFYEHLEVKKTYILLILSPREDSSVWDILEELERDEYTDFRIILSVVSGERKDIKKKIKESGWNHYKFIHFASLPFYYYCNKAGFLIADCSCPPRFIKKRNQVLLRFWEDGFSQVFMGNEMRNVLQADYLFFPNQQVENKAVRLFCMDSLYRGISLTRNKQSLVCTLRKLLLNQEDDGKWVYRRWKGNGKENIVLYGGDLSQNGITTSFIHMLNLLDLDRFNYFVSFRENQIRKQPERLKILPKSIHILSIASEMNMDFFTGLAQIIYLRTGSKRSWVVKRLAQAYDREWRKHFGDLVIKQAVHYSGYDDYIISLFETAACNRTIWVHNDMEQEIAIKSNQNLNLLSDAYSKYDHVVIVSEDLLESIGHISPSAGDIRVIGNCHQYTRVLELSKEPVCFQKETKSTVSITQLMVILDGKGEKFINIGRYSYEKGHSRLIHAFERYWIEHPDCSLIIIGGYGPLYGVTVQEAEKSPAKSHIILIKQMDNPMPVLKKCDLLILSSFFEGLGLVMMEADTLSVPVIACDVMGPRGFLTDHGGTLVPNNEEGILEGMRRFHRGEICPMKIDYEKMNRKNIEMCEALFLE